MSYQVLGLAGQQGAGKDYTYEALVELYGTQRNVRRMAFADGVRREVTVEVLSAFPSINLGDTDGAGTWAKPYTSGQRWLLQQWGTEYRRAQAPEYWIDYGMDYIEERAEDGDLWVVTDVRFENEHKAIDGHPALTRQGTQGATALVMAGVEERAERVGVSVAELSKRSQHASEVIDFTPRFTVTNYTNVILNPALLEWLGLDGKCIKCILAQQHIWHDSGEVFCG